MQYKSVVTSFLQTEQRILLLRRSEKVGTHKGKWAAVSGYLEGNEDPLQRAQTEIQEEVGLGPQQISLIRSGETLRAFDEETETVWIVHPFLFEARSKIVRLDWESSEYAWVEPSELVDYEVVPKLRQTLDRVICSCESRQSRLSQTLLGVEGLARDRVHGASYLGRQAIELMFTAVEKSAAASTQELFCDLLFVASKLRRSQPAMAVIRNLAGKLLNETDLRRESASIDELRVGIVSFAKELVQHSLDASEDASRNTASKLPMVGHVLTHSYSTAVLRALELGTKGGRKVQVSATESYPGMEGKQLAKSLVELGIPVRLLPDSVVDSVVPDVDLVLVGADSVLRDGSLIHKVGTKAIAAVASEQNIPVYSVCETAKFSTADFLGEPPLTDPLFDLTPSNHISTFVTEVGPVEPSEVAGKIRVMLREMYP